MERLVSVKGWTFSRREDGSVFIVCPDDGSMMHDFATLGPTEFTLSPDEWFLVVTVIGIEPDHPLSFPHP